MFILDKENLESLMDSKKYDLALKECTKYIQENNIDHSDEIYFLLARIYFNLKKFDLAHQEISKISSKERMNSRYYFLKGRILQKLGELEPAIDDFFIAVRKKPDNNKYLKTYISLMNKQKKYTNLYENLSFLSNLKKVDSFFLEIEKIKVLIKLGNFDLVDKLIATLSPKNIDEKDAYYEVKGDFYYNLGDTDKALNCYSNINKKSVETILKVLDKSERNEVFLNNNFDSIYGFHFLDKGTKNLTVVFSPILDKFVLRSYPFKSSVLFVCEKTFTYYTLAYEQLVDYINSIVSDKRIDKVTLTGSSKGSFAAINIGIGLSHKMKNGKVRSIAFSPQTQLSPLNENISRLPSYNLLRKKSKSSSTVAHYLLNYGNIEKRILNSDLDIHIVYGDAHPRDKFEAERLANYSNVSLRPIMNYPFHTSVLLYTRKGESLINALTNKVHSLNKDDAFFVPENNDKLVNDFISVANNYHYDLNELIL